ncbi:alpha/beta fold hydrolase [Falsiroseomonas sp. HW251]|uniref:alpha/beta fold hydrolase n=1 Tax=Falsiroseomonas sp. HW251 TaxID=3390998 RepID=UPI003D31803C
MSSAANRLDASSQARAAEAILPRHRHVLGVSRHAFHRIAYTEWGAPDAAHVAVCVHGLSRQGRDFDFLARALARRGYRVICPDLPGRGRSDWLANADDYGLPQYCSDMATVLAATGAASVDWIGTSLGGLIGLVVAGMPGNIVRRLVINDIGPYVAWSALSRIGSYLRVMPSRFRDLVEAEAHFRTTLAPFGNLGQAEWDHLVQHSITAEPDGRYRLLCDPGIARSFRPGLLYNLSLWRYWDAIRCRVLLLRGVDSDLLMPETAREMTQRGPRAMLVEVPGCGHAPPLLAGDQIATVVEWVTAENGPD